MVSLKYVLIVLHADNEGEGGTFSCYSLLTRYANITERDPREQVLVKMERHDTDDLSPSNKTLRSGIENSRLTRGLLKIIGVLAVSMVMADGVLTPAQSVLGAVQGLSVVSPGITSPTIVGTSCAILVVLFALQPLGTTKLASTFAPIVIVWLAFNAGFGIYNLAMHDYTVLRAFSPWFAIHFFMEKKHDAWKMLGGILLSFTGVEALFADLGAFSMRAIQMSWFAWCYPCLLLAYIGQAAYISENPDAYSNPFYNCVPPGMLYPSLIVAMLAAVVASQAMITALTSQLMKLSYCPQVKIVHTSSRFHGQLYVPFLNWILMCLAILVTAVYSNTTRLGNAYGVCVMFVTFFDTCMVTLCSLIVWRFSPYLVFIPWLFFATVDGLYLSSALTKVPDGAWFTITISGILACIFLLWRFGKENQWRAEAEDRFRPSELVTRDGSPTTTTTTTTTAADPPEDDGDEDNHPKLRLTARWGGDGLSRIRGMGIYFDKTGINTPAVFAQFVRKIGAVPDATVFFHLHPVETPSVADEDRYAISRLGAAVPGCYRLVVRHGFMDEVITPDLAALIYEQVRGFIIRQAAEDAPLGLPDVSAAATTAPSTTGTAEEKDSSTVASANLNVPSAVVFSTHDTDTSSTRLNLPSNSTGSGGGAPAEAEAGKGKGRHREIPVELRDQVIRRELAKLDRAYASKVMYLVGKEQMKIKMGTSLVRTITLASFLWIRDNTRAKIANLRLAMDRVVEVGFVKEI
ncbi:putative potassium transporter protein [Eutypa lata UCREL1]|uniref:Putative potassium transporter protein n=1 Tax=Eutypa lata (strain UCR-EL1) TaxID=1287681 RepID=M7TCL7_EUTLA|nr:putative potassium transporter protein [Eutypa lata UCREL1]